MFIADTAEALPLNATVTTLDGITTVLAGFIFVCLVLPTMVKHRSQFYAALACVLGIVAVHTAMILFEFFRLGPIAIGILQFLSFVLLVLSVGGLTVRELSGDMAKAYEVIRRGETEKEIIIPIGDRPPAGLGKQSRGEDPPRKVYNINNPTPVIDPDDDTEDQGIPLS